MPRTTRILGTILIVIMVAGFAEFMAYLMSCQLVKYSIGFNPLEITEPYEDFLTTFSPRLGWVTYPTKLDAQGSRPIPAFPDPLKTRTCVSLYGDSFTEGAGVDQEHAWSNVLSTLLHCRVANFGVSAYGTDQAYLRFLDNHQDQAKVVILGFLSENIMRNVNQLRNLISVSPECFLKPRFILNKQGELTLIPIPSLNKSRYETLRTKPEQLLTHEYFLPGGPSGYRRLAFPYTWGIFQVFPLLYKNVVLHHGTYYDLYRSDNPSRALAVTLAILENFCREARQRGKQPLILIMPTHIDLEYYRRHNTWIYQPVIDTLAKQGLPFLNAGPIFLAHLKDADVKTLYAPKTMYHLNEQGNALLARIVYDYLRQNNFNPGNTGTTVNP